MDDAIPRRHLAVVLLIAAAIADALVIAAGVAHLPVNGTGGHGAWFAPAVVVCLIACGASIAGLVLGLASITAPGRVARSLVPFAGMVLAMASVALLYDVFTPPAG